MKIAIKLFFRVLFKRDNTQLALENSDAMYFDAIILLGKNNSL